MFHITGRARPLAAAIAVLASACVQQSSIDLLHGDQLEGTGGAVEVLPAPPVITAQPNDPVVVATPVLTALPAAPELVYFEPLPLPPSHVITAVTAPSSTSHLNEVQSVEVEVEVTGGALGQREISVVFVSPQGLVWQRQAGLIAGKAQGTTSAKFSLPVASTFIEDQQLFGTWKVNSLDEGVELARTTFVLEE